MNLNKILKAMACIYKVQLGEEAITMLKLDLQDFSDDEILEALKQCRSELKYFPSIAEIKSRLLNHPEPNEAWASIPKSEHETACMTEEMSKAFFICRNLIVIGDMIGARMAFIENYKKNVTESLTINRKPKWSLSLGYDKRHREEVALNALQKKLISVSVAQKYISVEYSNMPIIINELSQKMAISKK